MTYIQEQSSINLESIYTAPSFWFSQIDPIQQELFKQSIYLINDARTHNLLYYDYSYVVMPASKGYEGYVKDLFLKLGLITSEQHYGKKFRVGKALNPSLVNHPRLKRDALYGQLEKMCDGRYLADMLWDTWRQCRNEVFHYFSKTIQPMTLDDAQSKIITILSTVKNSSLECKLIPRSFNNK